MHSISIARTTRSIRRRANGPESAVKCSAVAFASRASAGSSRSGGPATHHEQPAAPLVEVGEAFEEELRARTGRVTAAQQPVVEAEHRHHAVAGVERRAQRRMVVQAQVARQPQQRRHVSRPAIARIRWSKMRSRSRRTSSRRASSPSRPSGSA